KSVAVKSVRVRVPPSAPEHASVSLPTGSPARKPRFHGGVFCRDIPTPRRAKRRHTPHGQRSRVFTHGTRISVPSGQGLTRLSTDMRLILPEVAHRSMRHFFALFAAIGVPDATHASRRSGAKSKPALRACLQARTPARMGARHTRRRLSVCRTKRADSAIYSSRTTRNPTRPLRIVAATPRRHTERTCSGALPHEPPRMTRLTQPGFT